MKIAVVIDEFYPIHEVVLGWLTSQAMIIRPFLLEPLKVEKKHRG